jgi:hypothetical protein
LLLFEVGSGPPHDGVRRMARFNLWSALAAKAAGSADIANSRHPSSPWGHLSAEAEPVDLFIGCATL